MAPARFSVKENGGENPAVFFMDLVSNRYFLSVI